MANYIDRSKIWYNSDGAIANTPPGYRLIDKFISFIRENEEETWGPDVIFDIGSRDLEQSIEFSEIFPLSKIYSFEPNPEQAKLCKERSNDYPTIEFDGVALTNIVGELTFYNTARSTNVGASSLLKPQRYSYTEVTVPAIRLDVWMKENSVDSVDILWMDTQGTEMLVLQGMGDFLNTVKYIHCEACPVPYYDGHIVKDELERFLHDNGFETVFHPTRHPLGEGDIYAKRVG
jgi:FkbM family methyltransferase